MKRISPKTIRFGTAFILAFTAGTVQAQESKTIDGVSLGEATWQGIDITGSDFESTEAGNFSIRQKKLPNRWQESWRDKRNIKNGPLITMFYERSLVSAYSDTHFQRDFEKVVDWTFSAPNISATSAQSRTTRTERIGQGFHAAYATFGTTTCALTMRIFGTPHFNATSFTGDRVSRILVCQRGDVSEADLLSMNMAFATHLKLDGRHIKLPGETPGSYEKLSTDFFGRPGTGSTVTTGWTHRAINITWKDVRYLDDGVILYKEQNGIGQIQITLPDEGGLCRGHYNLNIGRSGAWNIRCPNGLEARGSFDASAEPKGTAGSGTDGRGNAIRFSIVQN